MHYPFLHTKLQPPALRKGVLERNDLFQILNSGADGRIMLVAAPAGFGKTTLVTQWLHHQSRPFCWLSLDKDDNSLDSFFNLMMAAVNQKFPEFEPIPFPQNHSDKGLVQTALKGLIYDLAHLKQPLIVVLDDYHAITRNDIHDALDYFIEGMPPEIFVIITTRERPSLSLPRWRARGWLTELTQADLKFDVDEAGRFLRETMSLPVADEVVKLVSNRVDGWVTGLQFTGLRLQKID